MSRAQRTSGSGWLKGRTKRVAQIAATLVAAVLMLYLAQYFHLLPRPAGRPFLAVGFWGSERGVHINGKGFRAGELVRILGRYPGGDEEYLVCTLIADANGAIQGGFTPGEGADWPQLVFIATGLSSGSRAQASAIAVGLPARGPSATATRTSVPAGGSSELGTPRPTTANTLTPTATSPPAETPQPQPKPLTGTDTPRMPAPTLANTPLLPPPTLPPQTLPPSPTLPPPPASPPPTTGPSQASPRIKVGVRPARIKPGENFIVRVELSCDCAYSVEVSCPASTTWCNYQSGPRSQCALSESNVRGDYVLDLVFHSFHTTLGAKQLDVVVNGAGYPAQVVISRD